MRTIFRLFVVFLLLGGISGAGWWYWKTHSVTPPTYRTAAIKKGDLLAAITATGTIEPERVIDVGAQVAGLILSFGVDPHDPNKTVDYRTKVEEGTILATIDDSVYKLGVSSARAAYEQAQATVIRAKADLEQMRAKERQAERDWDRAQKLGPSDALSQTDYDTYQANYESAKANVGVGVASVTQAEKGVEQADVALKLAQRNLEYCTITSPVKGEIIDRRVSTGQTVVASLNAPSLFLIAKDLTQMQVWAAVNEADIGNIHTGQPVTFTTDAVPFRTFKGTVGKVRLNAVMTQNVVNYTVEILTDNSDSALIPYLTANVQFVKAERHGVLTVPNTALRYTPRLDQVTPEYRESVESLVQHRLNGGGGSRSDRSGSPTTKPSQAASSPPPPIRESRSHGVLWVTDGLEFVKPIKVQAGVTDGVATEVQSEEISEGMEVIVGENVTSQSSPEGTNPFAPQMSNKPRSRG